MRTPTIDTRRILSLSAAPVAVLVAGLMVGLGSNAAFSSSTRSSGNNWSSGSVTLTDDDNGVAGFTVSNLKPMQTGVRCVVVTSSSTMPGVVKTYVAGLVVDQSKGLEQYVKLQIEEGTGGSFNDCTGFVPKTTPAPDPVSLKNLMLGMHDYASGGNPWSTAGTPGEQKTYRGTYVFDTTGLTQVQVDALQGGSVTMDFVWELQNS